MKCKDLIEELKQAGDDGKVVFVCDGNRLIFSEAIFTPKMPTDDPYDDTVSVVEVLLSNRADRIRSLKRTISGGGPFTSTETKWKEERTAQEAAFRKFETEKIAIMLPPRFVFKEDGFAQGWKACREYYQDLEREQTEATNRWLAKTPTTWKNPASAKTAENGLS